MDKERTRKIVKDKKKIHAAVDGNNIFINQTQLPLLCEKSGAIATPSASGSYGSQAVRQNTSRFKKFKILYQSHC